jgi:RNA polymerase sigma-70 factor (ECF subfamily)
MVFRTLARLTGQHNIEDLAQDVFLRLYRALPNFRGEAQISTYLYRITVNVAQNEWQRRRREDRTHISISDEDDRWGNWEERLAHPSPSALEHLEDSEFALMVEEHLQDLSQIERTILVLFHQEDQTYEQIAQTLSIPINTVRTHLHRGRKRLRHALASAALECRGAIA